jgi:hypothetical protein
MKITSDIKHINKLIKEVAKVSKSLRPLTHEALLCATLHAVEFENTTPLNNLLVAADYSGQALVKWCERFAPLQWVATKKDKDGNEVKAHIALKKKELPAVKADMDGFKTKIVDAATYWELTPANPEPKRLDLFALLKMAQQRTKAAQENKDNAYDMAKVVIDPDLLVGLNKLMADAAIRREANLH